MTNYQKTTILASNSKINVPSGWWYLVNGSSDAVTLADGSAAYVAGDHNSVTLGANAAATILGLAESVYVNGVGDSVTLGGNGQYATDANLDTVYFAAAGLLTETDASRVTAYGNNIGVTMGANDLLGAFGSGINVTVAGANDSVWIGRNGQQASDANVDNVWFAMGGSLYLQDCSRVSSYGDKVSISVGSYDNLGAYGSAINVMVNGVNDGVWIGRNGQTASDANLDNVWFSHGGSLYLQDCSRVSSYGDNVTIAVGSYDNLGAFGAGINVVVNGVSSGVWIGRNGENVAASLADTVRTSSATPVYLQDYSTVNVFGAGDTVYVGAHDTVLAVGAGINVIVNGVFANVSVGNGATSASSNAAPATVTLGALYGTLTVAAYANVVVAGAPSWTIAAGAGSTLVLNGNQESVQVGAGGKATLNGAYDTVSSAGGVTNIVLSGHSDLIYVDQNPGTMNVAGFDATDTLVFLHQYVSNFAQAMSFAHQDGSSVVIDDKAGHVINLANTSLSSLGLAQFQFV